MVDPVDLSRVDGAGGVVWSVSPEGFHTNLVVLEPGGSIASHRNDSLDVLMVVLADHGVLQVSDNAGGSGLGEHEQQGNAKRCSNLS